VKQGKGKRRCSLLKIKLLQERRGGVSFLVWKVAIRVAVETTTAAVITHTLLAVFTISFADAMSNGIAAGPANQSLAVSRYIMTLVTFYGSSELLCTCVYSRAGKHIIYWVGHISTIDQVLLLCATKLRCIYNASGSAPECS
jgi:hypothetical protein